MEMIGLLYGLLFIGGFTINKFAEEVISPVFSIALFFGGIAILLAIIADIYKHPEEVGKYIFLGIIVLIIFLV